MALETVEIDNGPRLVSPEPEPEDFDSEASLRPKTLEEYIGQAKPRGQPLTYLVFQLQYDALAQLCLLYTSRCV